ncbi:hypothetical protein [Fictibacillus halophilus]|uniref:hypothetical protein n=1 Tax=Fictibacillus halophilus TaxID=1610490 RepID=UPI001CFA57AE|nr:hypothetical protein [Fictibacillus halophilus]
MPGKDYIIEDIMTVFEVDVIKAEKMFYRAMYDHEVCCAILNCISDLNDEDKKEVLFLEKL